MLDKKIVRRAMVVIRDVNDYFDRVDTVSHICKCSFVDAKKLLAIYDTPPFDHACNLLWRRLLVDKELRQTINFNSRTVVLFGDVRELFSY